MSLSCSLDEAAANAPLAPRRLRVLAASASPLSPPSTPKRPKLAKGEESAACRRREDRSEFARSPCEDLAFREARACGGDGGGRTSLYVLQANASEREFAGRKEERSVGRIGLDAHLEARVGAPMPF